MDSSLKFQNIQEDGMVSRSLELQNLLQSLPKESAWGAYLYRYQGIWHFPSYLEALLFCQKHFQAQDTDIIIATSPKTGTTWLKSLVFAITKRTQYGMSDPDHPLLKANPHELVPLFEFYYHNINPNLSHIPSPRLFSTHGPCTLLPESVKTSKCRIVCVCRNPKDTFISLWHHRNKLLQLRKEYPVPLEEAFELFCRGVSPNGPIWDHALGYWDMSLKEPEKVLFLRYEDLKGDTVSQVKRIAEFLGFPFSSEEESEGVIQEIAKMCSFECLSNFQVNKSGVLFDSDFENKNFFRKGEVGDWKNYMTPLMGDQLDKVVEHDLLGSGLNLN